VRNSDEARLLTYRRRAGDEEFLIAINFSSQPVSGRIDDRPSRFEDVTPDVSPPLLPGESASTPPPRPPVALPEISLDAWGFRIYRRSTP
jgi:hypothetical protein